MRIRGLDLTTLAAALLLAGTGQAFAAKTPVYCSEGSPEGFNPQFFTTGTTLDASSVPMYNKLVEFDLGTTNVVAGLAESWTAAPDGLSYTFKLRRGVKFHAIRSSRRRATSMPTTCCSRTTAWPTWRTRSTRRRRARPSPTSTIWT